MSSLLPSGADGIIITGGQPFEQRLPIGFEGIVLTFSDRTLFLTVVNGMKRPIPNVLVKAQNQADTRQGYTDGFGKVILDVDNISTLTLTKEKTFKITPFNRGTTGNNLTIVFQTPMLE